MDIEFNFVRASKLDIKYPDNLKPDDWSLFICKHLGFKNYLNPISGKDLFNKQKFFKQGINIYFHQLDHFFYRRGNFKFTGILSILDPLMWVDPPTIKENLIKLRKILSYNQS